jgi:hypothetical protein
MWVKMTIDAWTSASVVTSGHVFRPVNRGGRITGERLGDKVVWQMLKQYAAEIGVPGIAPHDLRRTCAKLCRASEVWEPLLSAAPRCTFATHLHGNGSFRTRSKPPASRFVVRLSGRKILSRGASAVTNSGTSPFSTVMSPARRTRGTVTKPSRLYGKKRSPRRTGFTQRQSRSS